MVKTGKIYLFLCRSNEEKTENKGETWSRGTNSCLLFGVNVNLNLCILVGKRDSCRHSATNFSENVVVAGTSYQMYEVLSFCHRERA